MFSNKKFFDFRGHDKDSKYYNKESMGKKRENEGRNGGDSNSGICRFKSENVFNINKKGKGSEKAKGVSESVVKHAISHVSHINCLVNKKIYLDRILAIRSMKHKVYTIEQNKKSLVPYDDKRYYHHPM